MLPHLERGAFLGDGEDIGIGQRLLVFQLNERQIHVLSLRSSQHDTRIFVQEVGRSGDVCVVVGNTQFAHRTDFQSTRIVQLLELLKGLFGRGILSAECLLLPFDLCHPCGGIIKYLFFVVVVLTFRRLEFIELFAELLLLVIIVLLNGIDEIS